MLMVKMRRNCTRSLLLSPRPCRRRENPRRYCSSDATDSTNRTCRVCGAVFRGFNDLVDGLITGARNMIGIGVATATAGIIVGGITLTGVGLRMTEFVEFVSTGVAER